MNKQSISVIIPVYNAENTIIEVMNSITEQSRSDLILEIIIINDGSKDSSENVISRYINEYNGKISLKYFSQENRGVSAARNYGMSKAKGEWIAFCDADDVWLNDKLQHQSDIINKNSDIDFLGGYVFNNDFKILFKKISGTFQPTITQILVKFFPWPATVIMKKKIFEEIGGFELGRNHGEDILYFISILKSYNFYFDTRQVVDIGFGKRAFGESGLSRDLNKMYKGNVDILLYTKKTKAISQNQYYIFRAFYFIKHLRRKVISWIGEFLK